MAALAPALQAYFTERLINQRPPARTRSPPTAPRFSLLLAFTVQRTGTAPSKLAIDALHDTLVSAFLDHLECVRGNSP
jgi:integrase/recombinase XerD